mmetsp:Transcript_12805/g.38639  ORF Transcript_12805/g.38639 Transcript_12805/m.38639 type:complete len:279 (-) Transcript_12805:516-1352(-)
MVAFQLCSARVLVRRSWSMAHSQPSTSVGLGCDDSTELTCWVVAGGCASAMATTMRTMAKAMDASLLIFFKRSAICCIMPCWLRESSPGGCSRKLMRCAARVSCIANISTKAAWAASMQGARSLARNCNAWLSAGTLVLPLLNVSIATRRKKRGAAISCVLRCVRVSSWWTQLMMVVTAVSLSTDAGQGYGCLPAGTRMAGFGAAVPSWGGPSVLSSRMQVRLSMDRIMGLIFWELASLPALARGSMSFSRHTNTLCPGSCTSSSSFRAGWLCSRTAA